MNTDFDEEKSVGLHEFNDQLPAAEFNYITVTRIKKNGDWCGRDAEFMAGKWLIVRVINTSIHANWA